MSSDLEIIKDLEEEIGFKLPIFHPQDKKYQLIDTFKYGPVNGIFLNKNSEAIAFGIDGREHEGYELNQFPKNLCRLKHLKKIQIVSCNIPEIPPQIKNFRDLTFLFIVDCNLRKIAAEIGQLRKVSSLHLRQNNLEELPSEISRLTNLTTFSINSDSLKIPPKDIVAQGIEAINNYFQQLEKEKWQTQYLYEAKLLVIGDGGVGKNNLSIQNRRS